MASRLDGSNPHDILVDEVLRVSGISRGSLYHHFGDFDGLIHTTLMTRFAANVEADGAAMRHVAESAISKEDYWNRWEESLLQHWQRFKIASQKSWQTQSLMLRQRGGSTQLSARALCHSSSRLIHLVEQLTTSQELMFRTKNGSNSLTPFSLHSRVERNNQVSYPQHIRR